VKAKIVFIERKFWKENFAAFSLEKIYEQVARLLPQERFDALIVKVPYGNSFADILKNILFFKRPEADIYHVTGQIHYLALFLPRRKTVLTIHDVGFLEVGGVIRGALIKKLFLDMPVRRLNYITAVSETTREAILANTGCSPEKIRVIENPVQEHYVEPVEKEFDRSCPVILQVGITPNKNIPNLLAALVGINCRLRIIGNIPDDLRQILEQSGVGYENAFGLDDAEMREEYERADIVAFCSTFEGFGMPIIEAQSMRRAVITSDLSPMREVAGGGAVLADPSDPSSIRAGILKIINDDAFRREAIERGAANATRFDPRRIAKLYEELYVEMLEGAG
jgi:glycosyltransferase involved in cell wall biosynthesis